jgi:hypothetical protein
MSIQKKEVQSGWVADKINPNEKEDPFDSDHHRDACCLYCEWRHNGCDGNKRPCDIAPHRYQPTDSHTHPKYQFTANPRFLAPLDRYKSCQYYRFGGGIQCLQSGWGGSTGRFGRR